MTDTQTEAQKEFDKWFYTARDPVKDMPYGTHLIYSVCDNDQKRFEIGCELLRAAFEGGRQSTSSANQQLGDAGNKLKQAALGCISGVQQYTNILTDELDIGEDILDEVKWLGDAVEEYDKMIAAHEKEMSL